MWGYWKLHIYTVQLVSLLLLGDNTLVSRWFWGSWHQLNFCYMLSIIASISLSFFLTVYDTHKNDRYPFESLSVGYGFTLYVCILWSYTDTNIPFDELVRAEAIFNCKVKKWCGFLCLLVLSTVTCTHRNVFILSWFWF